MRRVHILHDRFLRVCLYKFVSFYCVAITRILPGLEAFLREILANENLSPEAEKQRLEFVKELEQLTKPPSLPPRPTNLKTQGRASVDSIDSVENADNDFASVQRKLSNIFYLRRDFDELNEHFVNGLAADEANKGTTTRKVRCNILKSDPRFHQMHCILIR